MIHIYSIFVKNHKDEKYSTFLTLTTAIIGSGIYPKPT